MLFTRLLVEVDNTPVLGERLGLFGGEGDKQKLVERVSDEQ